jgi:hypothetical protein
MGWMIQGSIAGRGKRYFLKKSYINPSNATTFICT